MPKRTRILFVNSAAQPGADTAIHAMIMRNLDRVAFEVHAACAPGPSYQALSRIPDLHLRPAHFGLSLSRRSTIDRMLASLALLPAMASLAGLAAYMRRSKIQIVHSTDRPRDAAACVVLARLTGAKSVIHVHVKRGDWMSPLVRWALVRADAVIGVSEFVARSLIEGGCSPRRTHAVLNAIDLTRWDQNLDPGPLRPELGIPSAAPVLVSISRLFHWKGHADLLRAIALVHREVPEVRLLIVGEDDPGAGVHREPFSIELKRLAAELGIAEQVVFTGFRSDVPRVLAASDIYAMPSFEEPFGLVFLEAMAMKKPVVALDNGGTPEVVEHEKTGLLAAPGDPKGLAANILTLIRSPELRARMGEQGRRRAEERFTPQRMALDTARVYSSITSVSGDEAPHPRIPA